MEVVLTKSKKLDKKHDARIDGSKTVSFGQKGASDFTKHKNSDRKERYIDRHKKMRVGQNLGQKLLGFTANMYFGISLLYKRVLILIRGLKI